MTRKSVVRWTAALSGTAVVASLLLASPQQAGATAAPAPDPEPAPVAASTVLDTDGVARYWTRERMESAVPLDLDADGDPIAGTGPATGGTRAKARAATTLTAPRSVGKLFFTVPNGGNAVCSAAAVNTAGKNVIITAAHCAHTGPSNPCGLLRNCPAYFSNFLFVPRYANGSAPDGQWVGTRVITHRQWIEDENLDFDQALIEVGTRNGRRLVDVVGGNGLAWNYPIRQNDISIWGWPAEAPYDGETVQRCVGSTTSLDSSGDAFLGCPMTGGASGGPWMIGTLNAKVGFIWAVTSRRTTSGPPYLLAHPLGSAIRTLLAGTGVTSQRGSYRPVASRWSSTKGPSLRALPATVGRGQYVRLRARAKPNTTLSLQVRYSAKGRWSRVAVLRTGGDGLVTWSQRARPVGDRWYRVRSAVRTGTAIRVRVHRCPLPAVRSATVVQATVCTAPVS